MAIIEIPVDRRSYTLGVFGRSRPNYQWGTPSEPDTLFRTSDDLWITMSLYASFLDVYITCRNMQDARKLVEFTEARNSAPIRFKKDKESGKLFVGYNPSGAFSHDFKNMKPDIETNVCFGDDEVHSCRYETDYLYYIRLNSLKIDQLGGRTLFKRP